MARNIVGGINFDEETQRERERERKAKEGIGRIPIGIAKDRFTIADEHGSTIGRR